MKSTETLKERFLRYVGVDTQSQDNASCYPSTPQQLTLLAMLRDELTGLGALDVTMDEYGYVCGTIPPKDAPGAPTIGLLAHVDTSNAVSGANIKPLCTPGYAGGDIVAPTGFTLSPKQFPELMKHIGKEIISTDGSTLLGADDKAGVAEIMTLAARLMEPDAPRHGPVRIGFTPDEEVGAGVDHFDVERFGAKYAYTVDGGALGEINYENFNAANAVVTIHGTSIHPGSARGRMENACLMGMEFQSLLPAYQNPACTDGYEGFFHLDAIQATVDKARLGYILRDHDSERFQQKKALFLSAADYMNRKYGREAVTVELKDSYFNMKETIPAMLVDQAKAAMRQCGVEPVIAPIRGGTDGARLSYMGLPCPNLCTGGYNCHGRYEFVPLEDMERIADILHTLVCSFAQ